MSKFAELSNQPCAVEQIRLPVIMSIKEASHRMDLPPHYLRRLCREVPGIAFQSGIKWYINMGLLAEYFSGKLNAPREV